MLHSYREHDTVYENDLPNLCMVLVQWNTKGKNEHVQVKNWDKVECWMTRICKREHIVRVKEDRHPQDKLIDLKQSCIHQPFGVCLYRILTSEQDDINTNILFEACLFNSWTKTYVYPKPDSFQGQIPRNSTWMSMIWWYHWGPQDEGWLPREWNKQVGAR